MANSKSKLLRSPAALEEREAHEHAAITLRKVAAVADLLVAAGENENRTLSDATMGDVGLLLRDLAYAAIDRSAAAGAV